jgi:hypothetical protein
MGAVHNFRLALVDVCAEFVCLVCAPAAAAAAVVSAAAAQLRLTRDASRWNPFHTDAFLWIDGAHNCNDPVGIEPSKLNYMLSFLDKLLITFFDYEPYTEIHGFEVCGVAFVW